MKKTILTTILLIGSLSIGLFVGYKIDRDPTFEFRCAMSSIENTVRSMQLNKDFENQELVNHLTGNIEISLMPVIYYYTEKPNKLSDFDKQQVKKVIKKIDLLTAKNNLSFLTRKSLSDEFKEYIKAGLDKIRSN